MQSPPITKLDQKRTIPDISVAEIRELLKGMEMLAVRPASVKARELLLVPALFQKLIAQRTQGVITIKVFTDGKEINIDVTE